MIIPNKRSNLKTCRTGSLFWRFGLGSNSHWVPSLRRQTDRQTNRQTDKHDWWYPGSDKNHSVLFVQSLFILYLLNTQSIGKMRGYVRWLYYRKKLTIHSLENAKCMKDIPMQRGMVFTKIIIP